MSENQNRAFMYGESVFTTMRMVGSQVMDWDHHFDRLRRGVLFLYGPFSQGDEFSSDLRERLENRLHLETGEKIIRLTVYRDQEQRGLIRAGHTSVSDLRVHVSCAVWDPSRSLESPLALRTCAAPERPSWWPSYLKCGNYLHTIMAQKLFLQPGDDDLLYLSRSDTITESSVANIFLVRKNKLFTPPAGPQVLEGVMRRKLLEVYSDYFEGCDEDASDLEQVYRADAVFATNSVRGLTLIHKVDGRDLTIEPELIEKLTRIRERLLA